MHIARGCLLAVGASLAIACSGDSSGPATGGGEGGVGDGGPTADVIVGDIYFQGDDGTRNPAVTTVAVGTTVTWTWAAGATLHSVESEGAPRFTSSAVQAGSGKTYRVTFTQPGMYEYDCAVHGKAMTGRIIVQ